MTHPLDSDLPDPSSSPPTPFFRPLIFGETLFDHFPDGSKALGGAPFNVAWHLRGFKVDPLLVSAVGADAEGNDILARVAEWGMDPQGIQVRPKSPTGRVTAELDAGEPRFHIEPHQAYDEIAIADLPAPSILSGVDLLYHGTLALRETPSRQALRHLRDTLSVPVLVDVNLRDPWWTRETLDWVLNGTDHLKVSLVEAALLSSLPVETREERVAAAAHLRELYGMRQVVMTLGAGGALAVREGETIWQGAPPVHTIHDTVGAGDAFSAVFALGIHLSWPLGLTLERAVAFSADLCKVRGATPRESALYDAHRHRWNDVV
jgi:fructokinase